MKNVQFVPNQLQDLISVFQVAMHVKEMFILSGTIWFIWYESYDKVGCIWPDKVGWSFGLNSAWGSIEMHPALL